MLVLQGDYSRMWVSQSTGAAKISFPIAAGHSFQHHSISSSETFAGEIGIKISDDGMMEVER